MSSTVEQTVRAGYAAAAKGTGEEAGVRAVAEAFGYSSNELNAIPSDANLGLSCGNPTAFASLRPGETVVDLGCGGGLDVFLAAQKIGPTGRAIGIDMTDEMLARARKNAVSGGYANVEFHKATIDSLPLDSTTVDCIISNCVINLAPDKPAVFREMARVLKPGGRLAISDIALKKPLPEELATDVTALVGCFAGALPIADFPRLLAEAGFSAVQVIDSGADLNSYALADGQSGCCTPAMDAAPGDAAAGSLPIVTGGCCGEPTEPGLHARLAELLRRYDINAYAASVKVLAVKPA